MISVKYIGSAQRAHNEEREKMKKQKIKGKKLLHLLLSSSLFLSCAGTAAAEEAVVTGAQDEQAIESQATSAQEFSMEEYVVTASRMPTKISETASNVTVIERAVIEQKNIKSVAEALIDAGVEVYYEGGSVGDTGGITLNGDNRIIILVNGRKINVEQRLEQNSLGYNLGMLPGVDSIERIEVVRGAASSMYGSAAVGGVINIITRKGAEQKTTAYSEFGSWNSRNYGITTGGSAGEDGKTTYMITAGRWTQDYYEYKDHKTGDVVKMPNSKFERNNASVRIDNDFGKNRILTFYYDHLDEKSGSPIAKPGTIGYDGDGNPYDMHDATAFRDINQNNVALAYSWKQGENITNNFRIYRNNYKMRWYMGNYNSNSRYTDKEDGIEWNQSRPLGKNNTIVGGFDWKMAKIDDREAPYPENKLRTMGIYVEDHWNFQPKWTLTGGFRYDDANKYDSENTVRFSLNKEISDRSNAFFSWGQFFRGPNAISLFRGWDPMYLPNPNLKPETGDSFTLGYNTVLPGGTKIQASLFKTEVENAFEYTYPIDPSTGMITSYMDNVAEQKKRGLDLRINHPLSDQWDVVLGYSYLRVKQDRQDGLGEQYDITNSNPNYYQLGFNYHQDDWNVNIMGRGATGRNSARGMWSADEYGNPIIVSENAFSSKQYWVLDISASYQVNKDIKAYAKVFNLTNRAYETTYLWNTVGSQPMSSRQFVIGVEGRL
jgi:vitamin B12 transporter